MPLIISPPFAPHSFRDILATCGQRPEAAFTAIGREITERYFRQIKLGCPSSNYVNHLWSEIWTLVHQEILPPCLAPSEIGAPTGVEEGRLSYLIETLLVRLPRHRTDDRLRALAYQVYVALLAPEFRACRQSYTAASIDESCPRQELNHCHDRISGSHCEDCPFFVALTEPHHRRLLKRFWRGDPAQFVQNPDSFLPEDFRALRVFWHLYRRNR